MDFVDKYNPKKISDVVGHKFQIHKIINWLDKFDENTKLFKQNPKMKKINEQLSCLTIIGDHGIGKTCIIKAILNDFEYTIKYVNLNNLGSSKDFDNVIQKICMTKTILNVINNAKINHVLLIDDLHSYNSINEKKFFEKLIKFNNDNRCFPIIFICNNSHTKIKPILKRFTHIIYLNPLNDIEMINLLNKITKSENMKIDDLAAKKLIVQYAQNDCRKLMVLLNDLKNSDKNVYNINDIKTYCDCIKKKKSLQIFTKELLICFLILQMLMNV